MKKHIDHLLAWIARKWFAKFIEPQVVTITKTVSPNEEKAKISNQMFAEHVQKKYGLTFEQVTSPDFNPGSLLSPAMEVFFAEYFKNKWPSSPYEAWEKYSLWLHAESV